MLRSFHMTIIKDMALQFGPDAKQQNADIMVILDGDGQHDPSYIPDFVNALTANGADIVIGSVVR